MTRTFHESLRFPLPAAPVQVVVKKRDAQNAFREVWSTLVDPGDMFIDRSPAPSPGAVIELVKNGDPPSKVDLLILGDGYTAAERAKFEKDARRLVDLLFATSPFKERRPDFNVWGLCPPAAESGISRPSTGRHRRVAGRVAPTTPSAPSATCSRSTTAPFRDIASFAPYDFVEILPNAQTYGGGGIFNLYATVAADSAWAPYVFVHEFGHHFAGLADEYYTSDVAYLPASEPRRAVGAERHRAARPGDAEVEGPGHAGHAAADAVEEGGVRDALGDIQARRRASAPPTGPRPRWTRCFDDLGEGPHFAHLPRQRPPAAGAMRRSRPRSWRW